jgi:hypothetical protein
VKWFSLLAFQILRQKPTQTTFILYG